VGCDEEEREEEEDDEEEDDDDLMLGEREADEVERMLVSVVLGLVCGFSSTSWLEESSTGWCGSMWFGVDSSISTSLSLVVDSFRSTDIVWFLVVSG